MLGRAPRPGRWAARCARSASAGRSVHGAARALRARSPRRAVTFWASPVRAVPATGRPQCPAAQGRQRSRLTLGDQ